MTPTASRFLTHLAAEADDLPYVLLADLIYDSVRLGARVVVPAGFSTDLASIPRLVQPLIPKEGKYNRPAVVHDWLYANGSIGPKGGLVSRPVARATADAVLREAMASLLVDAERAELIYMGVRVGGWYPWRKYRKADHVRSV